jgi:hypothetical protein
MTDKPVEQVIGDSLDASIKNISSMAEGYARDYLPTIVAQLVADLVAAGYVIIKK